MAKVFLILLPLVMHTICNGSAAEFPGKFELVNGLSSTHFPVLREDGETYWVPNEYGTLEVFKEEHIKGLLSERLEILSNFKKLYETQADFSEKGQAEKYLFYRDSLDRNEILIINNAKYDKFKDLNDLFGLGYDSDSIDVNHMKKVIVALEKRLEISCSKYDTYDETNKNLQELKEKIDLFLQNPEINKLTLGTKSFKKNTV